MKTQKIMLLIIGLFVLTIYCWATPENPNVGNPFTNRNTVPSANQRQRIITQPNNNQSGYFRGISPYGVRRYDNLGSPSISSLERRTGSVFTDRSPDAFRSNYNVRRRISPYPSRLQSSFNRSLSNVPAQGTTSRYVIPNLPQLKNTQFSQRPLAAKTQELDALLSKQAKLQDTSKLKESKDKTDVSKNLNLYDMLTPEQIKELIDQRQPKPEDAGDEKLLPEERILAEFMKEQEQALAEGTTEKSNELFQSEKADLKTDDSDAKERTAEDILNKAHAAEGQKALGKYKTFNSLADSKLAMYLKAGQDFLKEKQYYKAADAYSLATIWKLDDGRAYFGQSLALFAAGEYMSSAYYLSRAFELDSTLVTVKYDIAGIMGDRDTYENRIVEVSEWQQRSNSGELAFLMAYVFYQDGKSERAAASMKTALETMPDSQAVTVLKNIIAPDTPEK